MSDKTTRRTVGEVDGEFVLMDTWTPATEDLDPVHFAYVPLTPMQLQELTERFRVASRKDAIQMTAATVARVCRRWDARDLRGNVVPCRDAAAIAGTLDHVIVEGVCGRILDGRSSADAQAALADFTAR
ncbi:MAG TPA: hypothetical protein PKZ08_00610 [Vicinamibacterales bacterium]|nr:hypothetical protein [Vicinamibacterales bacterium]